MGRSDRPGIGDRPGALGMEGPVTAELRAQVPVQTPHRSRGVRDGRVEPVAAMKGAAKRDPARRIGFLDGVLVGTGNPLEDLP